MHDDVRLRAPIEVSDDDLKKAPFEQSLHELAVARLFDRLRGAAAERTAEELNHALEVDIFRSARTRGARVPAVRIAV